MSRRITGRGHLNNQGDGELKSYRQIAQDLGGATSHVTIRKWMREDFPRVYARMSKGDAEEPEGPELMSTEERVLLVILETLKNTRAQAEHITTPSLREKLVADAEVTLRSLMGQDTWDEFAEPVDISRAGKRRSGPPRRAIR